MQKLRKAYPEVQADARNNFDKVTLERAKMLFAYSNKEYESQIALGEYQNLDELSFYQDKFRILVDLFNNAIANKTKKSKLQADVVALLADNYGKPSQTPAPQYIKEPPRAPRLEPEPIREEKPSPVQPGDPREVLHSFFDSKFNEIEKNQVGFKSVLEAMPRTAQRKNVRSTAQLNRGSNDKQIENLNSEIKALNKKIQQEKEATNFNQGLYQVQKQDYENRIKDLVQQIDKLTRENNKIREDSGLGSNVRPPPPPLPLPQPPPVQTKVVYQYRNTEPEQYSPHGIRFRQNDLLKIKQKSNAASDYRRSNQQIPPIIQSSTVRKVQLPQRKQSEEEILLNVFPINEKMEIPPVRYQAQDLSRSNLRFARSEAENEDKNIAIRSKLSFFRPEIVLYRGEVFEVAVKSFDLIDLSSRKIMIYINNKDKFDRTASLSYSFDSSYYDLNVVRKVRQLRGCKQSKEEVQVKLKEKRDFDSMIEVKLTIQISSLNSKEINFFLPAMFIEFSNRKPQYFVRQLYEKNTITPIYQFSNIYSAMEIIPFDKGYEDRVEVATIFARSKYHEGYITLRWKMRGELQIETIGPWKLLFSFLLSKDY